MFAQLSQRLGLPLFGSARRDAALKDRDPDDDAIAAAILERARHDFEDVRNAPYGILDDTMAPGWLIPSRLPRPLDLAPVELVGDLAQFEGRTSSPAPLVLIGRRTAGRYNSLALHHTATTLLVNPADAQRYGLADGATATVATGSGAVDAVVEVTTKIRVGVVSLPHCVGLTNVNQLTSARVVDRRNGMPILSGLPVHVAPCRPANGGAHTER